MANIEFVGFRRKQDIEIGIHPNKKTSELSEAF
jgi:hypothetical protein